ncbi:hypothetical protein IIA29_03465 [candidate division KSB1 bacterium]|nr:hypothetical protein [candidate division KSB1 bacterium]
MKRNQGTADTNRQRKQPGMQVDVKLYARMKALAALRGVRIGDVIDEAMASYLNRQENRL